MTKKILFVFSFFIFQITFAQTVPASNEKQTSSGVLNYNDTGIEVKPEFPGGMRAFMKYIGANYNPPTSKDFPGGKVLVSFVIDNDGSVVEVKVLKDAGFDTDKEAMRVLKSSPKWTPAEQNGKKVRCQYTLPIDLPAYVFDVNEVDTRPRFKDGYDQLLKIMDENISRPTAKDFKGGNVLVSFVVETDGSISSVDIIRDPGFETGKEVVRILNSLKSWIPAQKNGKNVRCNFGVPVYIKGN